MLAATSQCCAAGERQAAGPFEPNDVEVAMVLDILLPGFERAGRRVLAAVRRRRAPFASRPRAIA